MKSLDLRIELRQKKNRAEDALSRLQSLHLQAEKSRLAVASATGTLYSGRKKKDQQTWEVDAREFKEWKEQLKDLNDDYSSMKPEELESE